MSAIFGVVHWDGRLVREADLARMSRALAVDGPDGAGLWRDGHAGLGHRLSVFTPEDRFERQPLMFAGGHAVLVADARIDNRDELAGRWSLGAESRDWPDSPFVARALEADGDEAVGRLRGAFALASWDARARRLLLARSPFAERPLFYCSSRRTFAFASMPRGLFALGVVDRVLDESVLADFLAVERPDQSTSFYRNVRRVPGGHILVATEGGVRVRPFWRPDLIRELRLPSDEAYVEAFLEVYTRAVRAALRSAGGVGVMMSGGLDSSSVAAMAAPVLADRGDRLAAFTEVPPKDFTGPVIAGRYADETPFVESLARRYGNIDLTFVRPDTGWPFDGADDRYRAAEAPLRVALIISWWDALMASAQRQGVRVLLCGQCGNFTASYGGDGLLAQLIAGGRWRDAMREARALTGANAAGSTLRTLVSSGVLPLLPTWMYRAVRRLRRPLGPALHPWQLYAAIDARFAREQRVRERARAMGPDGRLRQSRDTRTPRWQVLSRVGSILDGQTAGYRARFGLDLRDPTADPQVAEFCLSLPEGQFVRDGQRRWLVRRAMADRVPALILDNTRRGLQSAAWHPRLLRHRDRLFAEIARIERSDLARRAIDLPRLRRLVEAMPSANPVDAGVEANYRGVLDLGLEAGRFILWTESAARSDRAS